MWRETTQHERNLKIWQEELDGFVPARVLDFHVHVFHAGSLYEGQGFDCGGHRLTSYTFEDLSRDLAEVYPGRDCSAVCFGLPYPENNNAENNRYIGQGSDGKRFFGLRLIRPDESPETVAREVREQGHVGFKPYPNFVPKADLNEVEIHEMLPASLMRVADEMGLIVMLHIPRKGRLADALNQRQIIELCRDYPRARIVLAHIGRAYFVKNVVGYLDPLKDIPNLYIDLAMLNNWEVIEHAFTVWPAERILYGTDIPISLAAGKAVEINNQYTYVTPEPWPLSISDDHGRLVFTSFLYEELRAIKKAVERIGPSPDFVDKLFYKNGMSLLNTLVEQVGQ